MSSSASATSIRRDASTEAPKRTLSSSTRSGSTLIDPQPGRIAGRFGSETVDTGDPLPLVAMPADGAIDLDTFDHADHRRYGFDVVMPTHREVGVVDRRRRLGEAGVVLGVHGRRRRIVELAQDRPDGVAGRALFFDHHHDPIGEGRSSRSRHGWTVAIGSAPAKSRPGTADGDERHFACGCVMPEQKVLTCPHRGFI